MKFRSLRNRSLAITLSVVVALFSIAQPVSATTLTTQKASTVGVAVTYTAAAGSQNFFNTGKEMVHIKNASGGTLTVTFTAAGTDNFGIVATAHNLVVTIADAGDKLIGPFRTDQFNDSNSHVAVGWSTTTSVTVAVIRLP